MLLSIIGKDCFSSTTIGLGKIFLLSTFSAPTANAAVVVAVPLPKFVILPKVVPLSIIGKDGC